MPDRHPLTLSTAEGDGAPQRQLECGCWQTEIVGQDGKKRWIWASFACQRHRVEERFVSDTANHEMAVLRDDDLYRHLRFQQPGTNIYRFDIVTWPGYLAFVGDAGDWLFARTADMLAFFVPKGREATTQINPHYWSEKLVAPSPDAAETYSYQAFREYVQEWASDVSADLTPAAQAELDAAVNERLLAPYLDATHGEHEAHDLLRNFEHDGIRIGDSWEWTMREYRHDFLWCCFAIVWGIAQYRTSA